MSATAPLLSKKSAITVYVWLVLLTLLEVWIVKSGVTKSVGVILMAGTTMGKTLMIALYFMHMKNDRPLAWLLPLIPLALAIFFVVMLFPDLVYHLPLKFQ